MGNGVAYKIGSPKLLQLHAQLQAAWQPWLIPQDRQRLWPHVTVQNKVAAPVARALHESLSKVFTPFVAWGTGLCLWSYQNGPWEAIQQYPFAPG